MTNSIDSESQKKRADYTEGSVLGSIIGMGLPSMVGFLTQNIYNLVDMWWVSKLPEGESAVAALTFFGVILFLLFSFNQLVGPGSIAVISRRYGEKRFDLTEKAIKETLLLKLFFGTVFGVCGYFGAEFLLELVGARGEVLRLGVEYGRIILLTLAFPYAMYSIFTAMRAVANPQMAMILMLGSNLLNMALDPLLMFGYFGFPELGMKGAAVASVISFMLTFLIGIILFFSGRTSIKLHTKSGTPVSLDSMIQMVRIGIPSWVSSLSFSGARVIVAPLIATYGTAVIAAYGVGMQLVGFGIMIIVGIGLGVSTLIGHNVGAGMLERARHTANQSIYLSLAVLTFLGLGMFFYAAEIVGLFFENPDTIRIGEQFLEIIAISFPGFALFIMIEEIHLGVGLNTPMMIFSVINSWLLQVLPILLLVQFLEVEILAVWWVFTGSILISSIAVWIYYKQGRWLTVKV